MTVPFDELVEPLLKACRGSIEQHGQCHNMTLFAKRVEDHVVPLATLTWIYPDAIDSKRVGTRALGRAARAIGADLVVDVEDQWRVEYGRNLPDPRCEPAPSEHPRRTEGFGVHFFDVQSDPMMVESRWYGYERQPDGIIWRDCDSMLDIAGRLTEGWLAGLEAPVRRSAREAFDDVTAVFGHLLVMPLTAQTAQAIRG